MERDIEEGITYREFIDRYGNRLADFVIELFECEMYLEPDLKVKLSNRRAVNRLKDLGVKDFMQFTYDDSRYSLYADLENECNYYLEKFCFIDLDDFRYAVTDVVDHALASVTEEELCDTIRKRKG